ncbi:hypothetical protein EBR66_08500, partial [bacterium]|nr:hypothetical protein [bacterium]
MAILNGLTALGNVLQKESSAVLFIQNGLRTSLTAVVGRQAVAEAAEAVAAGTATVAQRALNAAMNANPVGILITLILAGVAALYAYTSATEGASEAEKQAEEQKKKLEEASRAKAEADEKEREKVGELSRGYFDLIIKLKQTDAGTKERQATLEKINKEYGTTLKNIKDESKFQDQLNASVKEYIALQVLKIRQQNQQKEEEKAIGRLVKAQDDLNKLVAEYAGKSKQEIEDYDQKTYGVSVYSDSLIKSKLALQAAENEAEKYAITSNNLQAEVDKLSLKFNKTETEVKTNTKSIKENQKSISNLADAYAELIKLTNEYNLQSTTAYLERVKTSLSEEVQLRQIAFDEKIKQEEENLNKVLKKVYDEEAKELQNKKEFTKKKKETDEQYTKRLEDEIKYRLKNDKNYADKAKQIDDAKAEYAKAVEAKKQVFIQETNQYILEQQQKQQEAAKKVASEILSPAQFEIFFKSVGRLTEKYVNIYETDLGKINDETKKVLMKSYGKAPEIDLRSFNNLVKNLTLIYQDNLAKTNITLSKDLTDGLLNSLKTGGKEVYSALNELQNSAYNISLEGTNKSLSIIRDLFGLGTDYLNGSIDDNTAYTLKIAALYQDKYQVIQDIEKSTYDALTKTQRSFFDATEAQITAQIDFIKNNKLLDRKRFEEGAAGEEEYNKALRKAAIERLKFTTEDNEKLSS